MSQIAIAPDLTRAVYDALTQVLVFEVSQCIREPAIVCVSCVASKKVFRRGKPPHLAAFFATLVRSHYPSPFGFEPILRPSGPYQTPLLFVLDSKVILSQCDSLLRHRAHDQAAESEDKTPP